MPPLVCIKTKIRKAVVQASGVSITFDPEIGTSVGSVKGLTFDSQGNVVVTYDKLVAKFAADLSSVIFAYTLDGSTIDVFETACVGPNDEVYMATHAAGGKSFPIYRINSDGRIAWSIRLTPGNNANAWLNVVTSEALFYAGGKINVTTYENRGTTSGPVVGWRFLGLDPETGASAGYFQFKPALGAYTTEDFYTVTTRHDYTTQSKMHIVAVNPDRTVERSFTFSWINSVGNNSAIRIGSDIYYSMSYLAENRIHLTTVASTNLPVWQKTLPGYNVRLATDGQYAYATYADVGTLGSVFNRIAKLDSSGNPVYARSVTGSALTIGFNQGQAYVVKASGLVRFDDQTLLGTVGDVTFSTIALPAVTTAPNTYVEQASTLDYTTTWATDVFATSDPNIRYDYLALNGVPYSPSCSLWFSDLTGVSSDVALAPGSLIDVDYSPSEIPLWTSALTAKTADHSAVQSSLMSVTYSPDDIALFTSTLTSKSADFTTNNSTLLAS